MRKKFLLSVLLVPFSLFTQQKQIDSTAVIILDRMSDIIGELSSCSFNLKTATDEQGQYGLEKKFSNHEVIFKGPDKMLVQSNGDDFHKGYWYNGSEVVYYSYRENNYSVIEAPETIMQTIDSINANYGIDFPAADFFYPAFTDDILADFTTLVFLGSKKVNDKDCFHILAENDKINFQVWISNDAMTLPERFAIIYKDLKDSPQYLGEFYNWKVNPELPDSLFEFTAPPEANQIAIIAKNNQ